MDNKKQLSKILASVHTKKYRYLNRINNLLILLICCQSILTILYVKWYDSNKLYVILSNIAIVIWIEISIWISYLEDLHKFSSISWIQVYELLQETNEFTDEIKRRYETNLEFSRMKLKLNYLKQ
jgi:hypothetical protein